MSKKIKNHQIFEIYQEIKGKRIYTKSIVKGTPFSERVVRDGGVDYREFEPRRSKLAAAIVKGAHNIGIRKGDVLLYLGASHGYTCSYLSDVVGEEGLIFGIDPAPRVMRDFVFLAENRKNLVPMLSNANHPEEYVDKVCLVDIVYQDIAQKNQAEIFIKNCKMFLKKDGYGLLAVKARSIDVKRKPKGIFNEIRQELEKEFIVADFKSLEPFQLDHCMIIVKKK